MDRAIQKASLGIMRHAIKDKKSKVEIPNTGKWVDDCWNTIGKAHFYKREFFSGVEAFQYVASVYKGKQKYEANLWLMKTYNELNALSEADHYASLIKNDHRFPKEYKGHFHALCAEFYIKQGRSFYNDAIKQLGDAIKYTKSKNLKARYYFILGQLYEEKKKTEQALFNYRMVVRLKPKTYDLYFYAKVKEDLMHKDPESVEKAREELRKMAKDFKNSDLLDVIYYTLGQLDENQKKTDDAFDNYSLSAKNSTVNQKQKARSYLKLADISFERENYIPASRYYDSTIALLSETFPGYSDIKNKKTSLDSLMKNINIIKNQDSLQRMANMDSTARKKYIQKIIDKIIKHEQDSIAAKEAALTAGGSASPNQTFSPQNIQNTNGGPAAWYFYNTMVKQSGLNDFIKKWGGNRKNEDNWRRSNKTTYSIEEMNAANEPDTAKKDTVLAKTKDRHQIEFYLKNLPLTPADMDSSNKKILYAYYSMGSVYREMLYNPKKAAQTFEQMNSRFPKNQFEAASYYQLYRIYIQIKNQAKADEAKRFLLANYPGSDFAKIINDPDFANSVNAKQSEVDAEYTNVYNDYIAKNYQNSYTNAAKDELRYGGNKLAPKFAYIKAMSAGYLYGRDSLEKYMAMVTVNHSKSGEIKDRAKATLDVIKTQKQTVSADTTASSSTNLPDTVYKMDDANGHYCMIVLDNTVKNAEPLKNKLSDFNKEYFSPQHYDLISIPKNDNTLITIRTFKNKDEAMGYYNFILSKPEIFASVDKRNFYVMVITTHNVGLLLDSGNFDAYKTFFNVNYLGLKQ